MKNKASDAKNKVIEFNDVAKRQKDKATKYPDLSAIDVESESEDELLLQNKYYSLYSRSTRKPYF
nr:9222_t:CDS:2 [Entrophospora candida]